MTNNPARANLIPANLIMLQVSEESIPQSLYPILIHGNALPQRKQHRRAPVKVRRLFLIEFLLSKLFMQHII